MTGHINSFLRAMVPGAPSASITTRLLIWERKTNTSSQGLWILLVRAGAVVLPRRQPRPCLCAPASTLRCLCLLWSPPAVCRQLTNASSLTAGRCIARSGPDCELWACSSGVTYAHGQSNRATCLHIVLQCCVPVCACMCVCVVACACMYVVCVCTYLSDIIFSISECVLHLSFVL